MTRPIQMSKCVFAFAVLMSGGLWAAAVAANPATVDYECSPNLPAGKRISVDFNSGGKSITVTFPNNSSLRLTKAMAASGERYVGAMSRSSTEGRGHSSSMSTDNRRANASA